MFVSWKNCEFILYYNISSVAQANARKEKLLDSYDLQRFLSDYRDLSSWIASMMGLVSSDELATDVTGAEALLERHQVRD